MEKQGEPIKRAEAADRYDSLPGYLKVVFITFSTIGMGVAVFFMFNLTIEGQPLLTYSYYYLLIALFVPCGYLIIPASKKNPRIQWYDLGLAALTFGITFYFFLKAKAIMLVGWYPPTTTQFILGLVLGILILELVRRINIIYTIICLIIGTIPLYAEHLPGVLSGLGYSWQEIIGHYTFGGEGLIGLPTRVMGEYVIGFVMFAGILIASGAGSFFLNLALAVLGRYRGGPAKVAVVGSGFFGSLSGSPISNIAATGSFTIPAMKRLGYPPHYAGAIEACASTGGIIMPPVMGATAFIMAVLLDIPYATIMVAAAIPAIFYYFGLLIQVDAHAAKTELRGTPREEIPSVLSTLKKGWVFIFVLVFLVWGLAYMRWEAQTPFYAMGLMILLSFTNKETMMTPKRFAETLAASGRLITQTMAILLPVGFIVGGLLITGTSTSLTAGLIRMAGENVFLILIMGAVICYILGMAGVVTPAYIFLALTMAPAVTQIAGLNTMAVHLFILYYAVVGGITPPVAIASFFAATMAGAPAMKTAFTSMRLGVVLYFIPFFFVLNPSLVLQVSLLDTLYWFILGLLGIFLIAEGLEGYLHKLGKLRLYERLLLVIAGLLVAYAEWTITIIGVALALFTIGIIALRRKLVMGSRV